ncbi:MAG: hypothetical protein LKJ50_07325 [Clostridiales bacterium]|jgi:hypothetical protein|nr:hypothetical protein [Clostridiales bacterium]MCI2160949.1 hypothetical protein [Oscillospiraceae bacterium]MCI1961395.1 hypothetical protein [Clostridiales bacterium]MCI2022196.1 hypothetical protein [Clostridiales bacterium]MCI2025789.1 hypothetical protein [Clostridiales bacterium]
MKPQTDFEKEQMEEIARRVEYLENNSDMESSDFSRGNWIAVWCTIIGSLALFVWGLFV